MHHEALLKKKWFPKYGYFPLVSLANVVARLACDLKHARLCTPADSGQIEAFDSFDSISRRNNQRKEDDTATIKGV